ncbi:MAG: hypothetical protein AB7G47_19580 [Mycolicibacterium sp.]|uniref:hypothetical protein n=1 Tax=Mycolicibacterium sp. TaxID=2320850 RepID=UPI003D0B6926
MSIGIGSRVGFRHVDRGQGTVIGVRSVFGSSPGRWLVEATVRLDTGGLTYAYQDDLERMDPNGVTTTAIVPVL